MLLTRVFLQGNNDDLILSCCLHYCKDKAKDFMPASKGTALPLCFGISHPPALPRPAHPQPLRRAPLTLAWEV